MTLQQLINLKVGDPVKYKGHDCIVKWRQYTIEEVSRIKEKDKEEIILYSKHFGLSFGSVSKSFMLRSMFPDPKVLELKEFS